MEARLSGAIERLRPGMRGVAKLETGARSRFWIWTHEISDWLELPPLGLAAVSQQQPLPVWSQIKALQPRLRSHTGGTESGYPGRDWFLLQDRATGRHSICRTRRIFCSASGWQDQHRTGALASGFEDRIVAPQRQGGQLTFCCGCNPRIC